MHALLKIDGNAHEFTTLLGELTAGSTMHEQDIQRLRQAFYRQGSIDRRGAAEIFHANRIKLCDHESFSEFYLEALTDFFMDFQEDGLVLPAEAEATLLAWLGEDASIVNINERRLTLRILLKAVDVPERFERRVLDGINENMLHHSKRWCGDGTRIAGVIDRLDKHLIRRLVRRIDVGRFDHVSPASVDFMLDLHRRALSFDDPVGWRSFLIETVALHIRLQTAPSRCKGSAAEARMTSQVAALLDVGYPYAEGVQLGNEILSVAKRLSDGDIHY